MAMELSQPAAASAQGGCLCGAIRYRISGRPQFSVVCHCATCRRATATPTVAWLTVTRSQLVLLSGEPTSYRSSAGVRRGFCAACGSALTYETTASPATIDITTVSLDDPTLFPPTREVWLDHRLPWQTVDAALAHYPQDSGFDPG
jgi:hypothetical protein